MPKNSNAAQPTGQAWAAALPPRRPSPRHAVLSAVRSVVRYAAFLLIVLAAHPVRASVSVQPAIVEQFPVASRTQIQVRVELGPQSLAGTGQLFVALPSPLAGNTTVSPSQISYQWPDGATSATAGFSLHTTQSTPIGTWQLAVTDPQRGSAKVTLKIERPGFRTRVSPTMVRLEIGGADATVEVRTDADPGLEDVTYHTEGFPPFLHFGGERVVAAPGFRALHVPLSLLAGAIPGVYQGKVQGTSPGADPVLVPLTVEVTAAEPPRFAASLSAARLHLQIGGAGSQVRVRTEADSRLGDVVYGAEGFPSFLDFGGPATSAAPAFRDVILPVSLRAGAVAGSYRGAVRGRAAGVPDVLLPLTVEVSGGAEPRLSASLSPDRVQVPAGGGAQLRIRTDATPAVGDVRYRAEGFPHFVTFDGKSVSTSPRYRQLTLRVSAAVGAVPGSYSGLVRGSAPAGSVDMPLTVVVAAPEAMPEPAVAFPVVERLRPATVARGSIGQRLEVLGRHFVHGARIVAEDPDVRIDDQRVVSDQRIVGTLSVRPGGGGGRVRLRVENPDGGTSSEPAMLLLYGDRDLAAPLTVRTAAILYPRAGTLVARRDAVRPRGMLATSGTGTVIGSWRLDGVPFDRFTVHAVGGEPVEVTARAAIPPSRLGEHSLELVIESPQQLATRPIPIVQVTSRPDRLRLLAPGDGQVIHPASVPTFRWTPVPGADGYRIELRRGDAPFGREISVADPAWRPSAEWLSRLEPGELRWQVRPRGAAVDGAVGSGRFVLLPREVQLTLLPPGPDPNGGPSRIRWSGGAVGILYRVDFYLGSGEPVHSALTFDDEYPVPEGLAGSVRLVVTGLAPGGVEIGSVAAAVRLASSMRPAVWRPGGGAGLRPAASGSGPFQDSDDLFIDSGPGGGSGSGLGESSMNWQVDLEGTVSGLAGDTVEGTESDAYLALSAFADEVGRGGSLQVTGDLSVRWQSGEAQLDADDNRNWLARGSAGGASLSAGSLSPTYLVDSEILSAGSPTGAFELGFSRGRFAAGYHETAADATGFAGPSGLGQLDARSVALVYGEPGLGPRFSLLGVESRRPADDFFDAAEADVLGVAADWQLASGLRVTAEAAWSDSTASDPADGFQGLAGPGDASPEDAGTGAGEGGAYRLSVDRPGTGLSYGMDLFYTDPGFDNPADEGFGRGGRPGVAHAELRLGRTWGAGSANLAYEYLENVGDADDFVAATRQNALELSVSWQPSPRLGFELGGEAGTLRSEENGDLFLPGSDQESLGWRASASGSFGGWTVAPELSFRQAEDRLDADRRSESSQFGVALRGSVGRRFRLSSNVSATRDRSGADRVETETLLLSLEPAWTFDGLGLALRPYFGYDRIADGFDAEPLETETYRLLVSWNREGLRSSAVFELGGDWRRSRGGFAPAEDFVARYTASVTLRWNWRNEPRPSAGRGVGAWPPSVSGPAPLEPMSPTA